MTLFRSFGWPIEHVIPSEDGISSNQAYCEGPEASRLSDSEVATKHRARTERPFCKTVIRWSLRMICWRVDTKIVLQHIRVLLEFRTAQPAQKENRGFCAIISVKARSHMGARFKLGWNRLLNNINEYHSLPSSYCSVSRRTGNVPPSQTWLPFWIWGQQSWSVPAPAKVTAIERVESCCPRKGLGWIQRRSPMSRNEMECPAHGTSR
jgi:hypothetical protein